MVTKLHIQHIRTANKLNKPRAGLFAALFAAIGMVYLFTTHAAGFIASFEAENSTKNSPAITVSDSNASGGSALKFATVTGAAGSCLLPKYPTPSCTGVPAGTTFTNTVNGDYTVTTPGQVIDRWHITGSLLILASNVTVKNSQIDRHVDNQGNGETYYFFTITDSTVGPPGACTNIQGRSCNDANQAATTNCEPYPGVGQANFTATRVYVRGHDDGFRNGTAGNVTVQDSYFYACYVNATIAPPDGSHSDGVQAVCGGLQPCSGFTILHNTIDLSGVPATFPLNLVDSVLKGVTANDNLLVGGDDYIIAATWRGGAIWPFHNNVLVKDSWIHNFPYPNLNGAVTTDGTCANQDWQGNKVVTIDSSYNITSTLSDVPCIN
jgi:hypothetical protein